MSLERTRSSCNPRTKTSRPSPTTEANASRSLSVRFRHLGGFGYSTLGWVRRANQADKAIVFFDELTTAAPEVQKAMLRPLQERWVGDTRLEDHVVLIAAGNPPSWLCQLHLAPEWRSDLAPPDARSATERWLRSESRTMAPPTVRPHHSMST